VIAINFRPTSTEHGGMIGTKMMTDRWCARDEHHRRVGLLVDIRESPRPPGSWDSRWQGRSSSPRPTVAAGCRPMTSARYSRGSIAASNMWDASKGWPGALHRKGLVEAQGGRRSRHKTGVSCWVSRSSICERDLASGRSTTSPRWSRSVPRPWVDSRNTCLFYARRRVSPSCVAVVHPCGAPLSPTRRT
jgi:hypothetical protein